MGPAEKYILSIGLAAILVAILGRFMDSKSGTGNLFRMICGLFLAFTVLKPVGQFGLERLEILMSQYTVHADAVAAQGEALANEAVSAIIKQKTESYILDKAGLYNCRLQVQVTMGEGSSPVPESVVISGEVSPYTRTQLQRMITEELAIPKERQKWIG